MFCFKCGTELLDTATVCRKCGAKISLFNDDVKKTENKTVSDHMQNALSTASTEIIFSEQQNSSSVAPTEVLFLEQQSYPSGEKTELLFSEQQDTPDSDKTEMLFGEQRGVATNIKLEQIENNVEIVQLTPGEMLGGVYRVIDIIGKGGFGYVYKAYHTRLEQEVVIKQIHRLNKSISNRTEADVLKKIKHTYLPQVHDFIEDKGTAFTIMDFVSGSDIDKIIRQGRKFRNKEIVKAAVQLCEAVSYLHSLNPPIIHSDIKPENIMFSDSGDICLIDMNVSLVFDKNASLIGGTPDYAPPEQMGIPLSEIRRGVSKLTLIRKGTPAVNERSDIYSVGASIYFMALGKVPAQDYSTKPIAEFVAAGLSEPLASIVAKAMSLDPAKRYKSVNEMLTALNNLGKLDRRYKALQVQRAVVTTLAAAAIFGFVSISRMGADKLKEEHEEKYNAYVLQMESNIKNGEYEKAAEVIELAKEFEPERIEIYLNEAKILSQTKQYEQCMEYPDKKLTSDILTNEKNNRDLFAQIYELAGNSAFELEMYEQAAKHFEKALMYSPKISECYRDLTISYARLGNIEMAETSLAKAAENSVSDDRLNLMQGEISAAKGEYSKAFDSFSAALGKTNDDYVRFRSLLSYDKATIAENSADGAIRAAKLMESELGKVSLVYSNTVREMLANEYARCGELLGNAEYYSKSAQVYGGLMGNGNLSYSLKKNYFNILFSKLNEYDSCLNLLNNMEQENSSDYWVPMSRAYVQISVQNAIEDQGKRDYNASYESYLKAEELYKQFVQNGKSDPNMDTLRASINDLKNYGWIKEN